MDINPLSLYVGQYVSINRWKIRQDKSWLGEKMRVEEICLPHVVVTIFGRYGHVFRHGMDTREVQFCSCEGTVMKETLELRHSTLLYPREIVPGMNITVNRWLTENGHESTDFSWVGDLLKVEWVNHPRICVRGIRWDHLFVDKTKVFDLRRTSFRLLSDEYVDALMAEIDKLGNKVNKVKKETTRMKTMLPAEIRKGMFCMISHKNPTQHSWETELIRIDSVDLPNVVTTIFYVKPNGSQHIMDTNKVDFREVSDEFANAILKGWNMKVERPNPPQERVKPMIYGWTVTEFRRVRNGEYYLNGVSPCLAYGREDEYEFDAWICVRDYKIDLFNFVEWRNTVDGTRCFLAETHTMPAPYWVRVGASTIGRQR